MKKTKKEKNKMHSPAGASPEQAKPVSMWSFDIVLSLIVLLGVLYHWVGLNYDIITGTRSIAWPQTTGVLVDVHIADHRESSSSLQPGTRLGGRGTTSHTYEVVPTYEYTIEGKQYVGKKVTTGGGWFFRGKGAAQRKADGLRPQSPMIVYYDPAEPSSALLEQGVAERTSSGMLVTIPLAGIAMGMAFYELSGRRIPERRKQLMLSLAAGTGLVVLLSLLQWFVLGVLV